MDIQIGVTTSNRKSAFQKLEKIRSFFSPLVEANHLPFPFSFDFPFNSGQKLNYYFFGFRISGNKILNIPLKSFLDPVVAAFENYASPLKIFLCHATEDKPTVEQFAEKLKTLGKQVWFDKWEIKIGDSIVERINSGLENMTHIVIFLSKSSVNKPWIRKELSVGLMRKLTDNSVRIIPLLLDKVELPAILKDIKYADCSDKKEKGFKEAIEALTDK